MLTKAQGNKLLKMARDAISGKKVKALDKKEFSRAQGCFVTLTLHGELRGCIGFPYPTKSLGLAVVEAAQAAALHDPRFKPLDKEELRKIKIEISVLTEPEEILVKGHAIVDNVDVGKDGLIVSFAGFSGLLLPQVAKEMKWTSLEFLEATCNKAGLPRDAWLNPNCRVFKFQAQIFTEKKR